ncbi:hypothetical protein K435DRAFT_865821 [Dendrothele bispora CBS 962.96]|uniref:Uncharacterized protein n=1 Tax=Dendrothele bispora (strain CBS 962.96) TaxID=1314807 RepID=A0A4S8LJW4_DENBC|nr:hypothetical protein K435DRAFT_865821 [Dendrothele bispora CBS 962.96]
MTIAIETMQSQLSSHTMSCFPRICEDIRPADKKSTYYIDKLYPKYILPVGSEVVPLELLPGHTTTWSTTSSLERQDTSYDSVQPLHFPPLSLDADNGLDLELNRSSTSSTFSLGNPILTPYPRELSIDSVDGPSDVEYKCIDTTDDVLVHGSPLKVNYAYWYSKGSSKLRKPLPPTNRDQGLPAPYALVHENTGIPNSHGSFQIFVNLKPFSDPSNWKEMTLDWATLAMAGTMGSDGAIGTTTRLPTQPDLSLSFIFTGNPPNLGIKVCWINEGRRQNIIKSWKENLTRNNFKASNTLWLYGVPSTD